MEEWKEQSAATGGRSVLSAILQGPPGIETNLPEVRASRELFCLRGWS